MSRPPTTIVSLTSENVKRLSAVTITPGPGNVVIGGQNGAGKSSVLDSIAYALAGKDAAPAEPIRRGQKSAKIVLETQELIITRKFTPSGSTLEVTNKEGLKYPSPQAVLDKLCATIAFDPLAFIRADAKKQLVQLRDLTGLDTSEIEAERAKVFTERTTINRQVDEQKALVSRLPETGPERVNVQDLLTELSQREAHNKGIDDLKRAAESEAKYYAAAQKAVITAKSAVTDAEVAVQTAQDNLDRAKLNHVAAGKMEVSMKANLEKADSALEELMPQDLEEVREKIRGAEEVNRKAAQVEQREKEAETLSLLEVKADNLTAEIKKLDADRAEKIAATKFPVQGLGFGENGVTYNDIPLEQASSAEQLRVGLAIACAMNPSLKVMLIRDGSLLDDNSLNLVAETAAEHGAQVWIERVGKDEQCTVVIEDGHVEGVEPAAEAEPEAEPVKPKAKKNKPSAPDLELK